MKRLVKPAPLRPGDVIGIVAPAGPPSEDALGRGVRALEGQGYRVEIGPRVLHRRGYLAGSEEDRLADLRAMFSDRRIRAVIAARGGYGSQRLLPLIDYDLIARNPKILMGYSDLTSLLQAVHLRTGLVVFHGPMAATDLARGWFDGPGGASWSLLAGELPPVYHGSGETRLGPGSKITARLTGGCLSLLHLLPGTPFAPALRRKLLFFEDIAEDPYKLDRMLTRLKLAGWFRRLSGVIAGSLARCLPQDNEPSLTIADVFQDVFGDCGIPVVSGFSFGHEAANPIVPLGIRAELDPEAGTLRLLERATG